MTVIAYDKGNPSLSSLAKLWVTVADTSDSVPDFPKAIYTLEVAENAKVNDTVFTLNAGAGPFKYSLLSKSIACSMPIHAHVHVYHVLNDFRIAWPQTVNRI